MGEPALVRCVHPAGKDHRGWGSRVYSRGKHQPVCKGHRTAWAGGVRRGSVTTRCDGEKQQKVGLGGGRASSGEPWKTGKVVWSEDAGPGGHKRA